MTEHWYKLRRRFGRRQLGRQLSAFIDGELDADAREDVATQAALDPTVRLQLQQMRRVDALVDAAMHPETLPDPDDCATAVVAGHASTLHPDTHGHSRLATAAIASVGLLLTAGVTFIGLRRRGLV